MGFGSTALHEDALVQQGEDSFGRAKVAALRTDSQLVELVLAGDGRAFEDLFDRHKRLVAGIASRYFNAPDQIEEIVQVAFAKVFHQLQNFRGDHDMSFVGWLAKITANSCLDQLRTKKRRNEDLAADLDGFDLAQVYSTGSRGADMSIENRDLARKLLSHVAADDRALLQMLYADEMSIAEIAVRFGWSESKTKVRAWRARRHLRKVLKRYL
ncbi:MAG: RNA polymerase sigma factor [Pyrinomonadaceae bacterium]